MFPCFVGVPGGPPPLVVPPYPVAPIAVRPIVPLPKPLSKNEFLEEKKRLLREDHTYVTLALNEPFKCWFVNSCGK